jgi:hypothetical protein
MPYTASFHELPTATVSFNLQNPGFNPPFTCRSSSDACWNCVHLHRRLSTPQPVFSSTLLTYWPQHSVIQNTPTCSHSGNAILQTPASTLVWAHWVTTSKWVTIPSTQSYRFSGGHSYWSSNDGLSGFSHHVNICWDILKECSASTLQVTIWFSWMLR